MYYSSLCFILKYHEDFSINLKMEMPKFLEISKVSLSIAKKVVPTKIETVGSLYKLGLEW